MIDLLNEHLVKENVDDVIAAINIERVSIETDMTGFEKFIDFYGAFLSQPTFSESGSSTPSSCNMLGVHPDGTGLIVNAGKDRANAMYFYQGTTLLETIVNYR